MFLIWQMSLSCEMLMFPTRNLFPSAEDESRMVINALLSRADELYSLTQEGILNPDFTFFPTPLGLT